MLRQGVAWSRLVAANVGAARAQGRFDPAPILGVLQKHAVDFVVVGGLAGMAHGSRYPTDDTDVAYSRTNENLERLADALRARRDASGSTAPRSGRARCRVPRKRRELHLRHVLRPLRHLGDPAGAPRYEALHVDGVEGDALWRPRSSPRSTT